ncbi:MAG: hypothetical protein IPJ65_00940 [Archangiaceae bacterium]|nr:hypothetical protein [Archangiaceae bacterium]
MNVIALGLVLAASATAPKLAMPSWQRVEVTPELGAFYADHLARALRANGLDVITSEEISALLGVEREKQLLGCSDGSSCMAELGNALGCGAVVRVSVARLDASLRANISVLSAIDGAVKAETSVTADGQERFFSELDGAAARLADQLTPKTGGQVRKLFWVPAAVGALALLLGITGEVVAQVTYGQLDSAASYSEAQRLAQLGKGAQGLGAVLFVAAGVGAAGAALMYVLGGPREVTPTIEVAPTGAKVGLLLRW